MIGSQVDGQLAAERMTEKNDGFKLLLSDKIKDKSSIFGEGGCAGKRGSGTKAGKIEKEISEAGIKAVDQGQPVGTVLPPAVKEKDNR